MSIGKKKRKITRSIWRFIGLLITPVHLIKKVSLPQSPFDFNRCFDHIYVINLARSEQRRKHIQHEFSRVGISTFEFFEAIDKNSAQLQAILTSDLVYQGPNCLQCKQKACACKKKSLSSGEIANFCSMTNVWKDIIKKDYPFCLICEDDIQFTPYYNQSLSTCLSATYFKKHRIDMNKPLLIRMSSCSRKDYFYQPTRFSKQQYQSNHCYAVNKAMAQLLLDQLTQMNQVSDKYIHRTCVNNNPQVQHFTIHPLAAHDLSTRARGIMPSEIRT
jgi:GR25 family glycosyltransferase involved in LPS biosynthesis